MIFLTDGLPTRGVTDSNQILMNAVKELPDNVRLFPFGVGYDVDTFLLDSLAQNLHGMSTYVQPGEALDERLSAFYEKISTPVLTDLQIDFGGLEVYDVFPNPLPDLFEGNQVIITGRYRNGKLTDVTVSGDANGKEKNYRYPSQRFADGENSADQEFISLPRLWATRKIGYSAQPNSTTRCRSRDNRSDRSAKFTIWDCHTLYFLPGDGRDADGSRSSAGGSTRCV